MITFSRNGFLLRAFEYGASNEVIVLLHGFPSYAESWSPIANQLASQGYRVLALEQRGYGAGVQPGPIRNYVIDQMVEDVAALLNAAQVKTAHIVGHDWGGAVAWAFADRHPERTLSLTSISAPHPAAFGRALWTSRQFFMSWYMFFFQLPFLPELIMKRNHGSNLAGHLAQSGLDRGMAADYTKRMLEGSTLTSALDWYRALRLELFQKSRIGKIRAHTLFLYGGRDIYISRAAATLTRNWVTGPYSVKYLRNASHWIPEELPGMVAELVLAHITHAK